MSTQDHELVRELFSYQEDGTLVRKIGRGSNGRVGDRVGSDNGFGYLRTTFKGKLECIHRLVFLYHTGRWPSYLDHIDQNRSNNRIENLRECTYGENHRNKGKQRTRAAKSSQYKGVAWSIRNKWRASIVKDKKTVHLGYFINEEDAAMAYNEAASQSYGIFFSGNIHELNRSL